MTEDLARAAPVGRGSLPASPGRFAHIASSGRWSYAAHLQLLDQALLELMRGDFDRLLVAMPPRHGKSELCSKYLPAWFLGTYPDARVMLTSYDSEFAESWGRKARNLLSSHGGMFGVSVAGDSSAAYRWDLERKRGGMAAVGVGGAITGKGANLLIIDDPVKNSAEAMSRRHHEQTWEWWESTALTRLEPGARVVVMQTRWHEDDLAGRLLAQSEAVRPVGGPSWRVLCFPALAEESDACGRLDDEALWPRQWPDVQLSAIRASRRGIWWNALYQQHPVPPDGHLFAREALTTIPQLPGAPRRAVRYWDKAASDGRGDFTAGVLLLDCGEVYVVADVVRGQWSALERNQQMRAVAASDRSRYREQVEVWIEQEPGSSGKEAAERDIRNLAGSRVRAERPTGSKSLRADAFAAQVEGGNVRLLEGPWNREYIEELTQFPFGAHDDQVDASTGAFNRLADATPFEVWVR